MKGLVPMVVFILAFATCVSAQDQARGITAKGIKVGLNISNFTGTGSAVFARQGYDFGAFLTYNLSAPFAIQSEMLYMQKGTAFELFSTQTWETNYLEIPILAKYTIPTNGTIKPSFFAGPALALLLSAKYTRVYEGVERVNWNIKDGLKSADFGLAVGGGLAYQIQGAALTFDIRYTWDLTGIFDVEKFNALERPEGVEFLDPPDSKQMNLSLLIGAGF